MDFSMIDRKFSCYSDLESALNYFSEKNKVHLYKRDARKLESASGRNKIALVAKKELVYYSLKYACIHGGKDFSKKKNHKGERETKTRKTGCQFCILFLLTKDGQHLEMSAMNPNHDHIINEEVYKMHPKERRLPREVEEKANELLKLRVNKKLLQAKLMKETGKNILLKDLSNIDAKFKAPRENLDGIVNMLQREYGCHVDILHNENILHGIFFQDENMTKAYKFYPEVLFLDGTYKLLDVRFICFIFLVEDGNGNSEIVGVGLLAREDATSVEWLVNCFQKKNSNWNDTRVIMTDKDFVERKIMKQKFPMAKLLICKFHVLRTFKREVTSEKMGLTNAEVTRAREFLTKMSYSVSEDQYFELYELFKASVPMTVVNYFDKNWHPIYKEWTHMACLSGSFLNLTNNRVESINAKLKSVIKPYSSLSSFVESFFIILKSLRNERDFKSTNALMKMSTSHLKEDHPLFHYSNILLEHPFNFIVHQYDSVKPGLVTEVSPCNFSFLLGGKFYPVNINACSCLSYNSMKLPCKHILAVRKEMKIPLFDSELINKRWTKEYMIENQRMFTARTRLENTDVTVQRNVNKKPKARNEKFRMASVLATELADIASESCGAEFDKKMLFLQDVINNWKNNKEVHLCASDVSESNAENSITVPRIPEEDISISSNMIGHDYVRTGNSNDNTLSDTNNFQVTEDHDYTRDQNDSDNTLSADEEHIYNYQVTEDVQNSPMLHSVPDGNFSSTYVNKENSLTAPNIPGGDIISVPSNMFDHCYTRNQYDSDDTLSVDEEHIHSFEIIEDDIQSSPALSSVPIRIPSTYINNGAHSCSSISLPPVLKKRGRSKGFDKTVIGLQKKKTP